MERVARREAAGRQDPDARGHLPCHERSGASRLHCGIAPKICRSRRARAGHCCDRLRVSLARASGNRMGETYGFGRRGPGRNASTVAELIEAATKRRQRANYLFTLETEAKNGDRVALGP